MESSQQTTQRLQQEMLKIRKSFMPKSDKYDEDLHLLEELGGPLDEGIQFDLQVIQSKEFTDNAIIQSRQYRIPGRVAMTDNQLGVVVQSFQNVLMTGNVEQNTARYWLMLALHLQNPEERDNNDDGMKYFLLRHVHQDHADYLVELVYPNDVAPQRAPGESEAVFLVRRERAQRGGNRGIGQARAAMPNNRDYKYWSFCAAWALRAISRSAINLNNAYQAMREQFRKFYPGNNPPDIQLGNNVWANLKALIEGSHREKNTWVHAIASFETTGNDQGLMGLVRYLATIPLSFTGMHSYALFLEVLKHSGASPNWLLSEMAIPSTRRALTTIRSIFYTREKKKGVNNQNYTSYYKYARIIGPEYYQDLQSKQCASLVYLLAVLLPHYVHFKDNQRPENIMALKKLGNDLKRFLQNMAKIIVDDLAAGEGVLAMEQEEREHRARDNPDKAHEILANLRNNRGI